MDRNTTLATVMRALRAVSDGSLRFSEAAALRLGLSASDVETLEVLRDLGGTTAGRLSELTGLTTGAVTRMIDRLEHAGYVRRIADPADRRRVVVEIDPERLAAIGPVLDSIARQTAAEVNRYTDAQLALIGEFLERVGQITMTETEKLRGAPTTDAESEPASEHAAPLGGLTEARLLFRSGVPDVTLTGDPSIGELYRARFQGPVPKIRVRDGTVSVHFPRSLFNWRGGRGRFALSTRIPWRIEVTGGTGHLTADLARATVKGIDIVGGANDIRLALGPARGTVPVRITGGADKVQVKVPGTAEVALRVTGGASRVSFAGQSTRRAGGMERFATPSWASAVDRYDVEVTGGASRVTVERE